MSSAYTRFLSDGNGPADLSDSWPGWRSFSVKRGSREVDLNDSFFGGANSSTSLATPPGTSRASAMSTPARQLPAMPEIGRPESYYANLVRFAEREANEHLHEAAKVGQYVTLAMDPSLDWDAKLKYFRHVLKRHCQPPPYPDDDIWMFYKSLADLVRQHCGFEALRLASVEDDLYAARINMGQTRETIENEAEIFFFKVMGSNDQRPDWFNDSDWQQLKMLRDQWI